MLKGISPVLSPELLAAMCRMGHGDEIVLADAHFPGHSVDAGALRADGVGIDALLAGILPLFSIDTYAESSVAMMAPVADDTPDPGVEKGYRELLEAHASGCTIDHVERFAFYERARNAFVVVVTGDTRTYANLILRKGVTPT